MSQENICHGTQEKKDLKTRLPEVEDVQCFSCFEPKQSKSEKSKGMLEKRSTQSNVEDNSEEKGAKADAVIPSGPASDILNSLNVMITKQKNTDDKSLYSEMIKDLETYMNTNEENSVRKTIDKILEEIENGLKRAFKVSKTPAENSSEKLKNKSNEKTEEKFDKMSEEPDSSTAKFIRNLQKRNKDCIIRSLNGLLNIQQFEDCHYVVLNCAVERICYGETLLHIAFKFENTCIGFAKYLMNKCPKLLIKDRSGPYNVGFEGQTPLHVAIVGGSLDAVKNILKIKTRYRKDRKDKKDSQMLNDLLKIKSKGNKFSNTVLMGQLPLTVAALACKQNIMEKILAAGAKIWWKNEYGDTVFHSLIKYADIYPEKIPHLRESFEFLWVKYTESGTPPKDSKTAVSSTEERPDKKKSFTQPKETKKAKSCSSSKEVISETKVHPKNTSYAESTPEEGMNIKISNMRSKDSGKTDSSFKKRKKKNKSNTKPKHLLFWKNQSGLTPLHLSAKLGVGSIFDYIVNVQYRFTNIQDGLFDIREYDVTEFDRLIEYKEKFKSTKKLTVLERLFDPKCTHKEAFQLLNQELIAFILHKKWMAYKCSLILWMILHFIYMSLFTASTIIKAEVLFCLNINETICDIGEIFIPPVALYVLVILINLLFGISYLIFFISCAKKLKERCNNEPGNSGLKWHNLDYVICLLVIAVGALMEMFLIALRTHWDFHVILVLICGWYFMLYFSPFHKNLVSFTYMIKKGFLEDFVPFGLVFLCLLVSFTGIMHMLFLGTEEKVDEFYTFQDSLLTMFNLGVGLNNIDVLNQARVPWLAYTVFVVFAILSFIHLFNAFIAVMSQTFSDVHTDKHSYLKYNKLRMIELFEDIVLQENISFRFLEKAKHWKTLENVDDDDDDDDDETHEMEPNEETSSDIVENSTKDKNSDNELNDEDSQESDAETEVEEMKGNYDKKRYYTVLHLLDDPNDDIDEKEGKKSEPDNKLNSYFKNIKTSHASKRNKPYMATDITYIAIPVDFRNRATQTSGVELSDDG